ncbi:hypothetical protein FGG78_20440 [Thioclava sp. BHET1]|nr:hypothetical protein FGG78_20440 [Thioclava sp. BHET1]
MIEALLPVRTITLRSAVAIGGICVLPESTELMPGLSLGDVLAEELDLSVPYGVLIVIEESADLVDGEIGDHQIDGLLERVMEELGAAGAPDLAAARLPVAPFAGFRDHRLNARFFQEVSGAFLETGLPRALRAAG